MVDLTLSKHQTKDHDPAQHLRCGYLLPKYVLKGGGCKTKKTEATKRGRCKDQLFPLPKVGSSKRDVLPPADPLFAACLFLIRKALGSVLANEMFS